MKIIRLEIEDDSILAGLDAMALVEKPATEEGFFAFSAEKFAETYSDYPEAAVEAAKQGIKRNEETGNKYHTAPHCSHGKLSQYYHPQHSRLPLRPPHPPSHTSTLHTDCGV